MYIDFSFVCLCIFKFIVSRRFFFVFIWVGDLGFIFCEFTGMGEGIRLGFWELDW